MFVTLASHINGFSSLTSYAWRGVFTRHSFGRTSRRRVQPDLARATLECVLTGRYIRGDTSSLFPPRALKIGCVLCGLVPHGPIPPHAAVASGCSKPRITAEAAASSTKKPSGSIGNLAPISAPGYRCPARYKACRMPSARTATGNRVASLLTSTETYSI